MKAKRMKDNKRVKPIYILIYILAFILLFSILLIARYSSLLKGNDTATVAKFDVNYEIENTDELKIDCNNANINTPSKKIILNNNSEVMVMASVKITLKDENNNPIEFPQNVKFKLTNEDGSEIDKSSQSSNVMNVFDVPININTSKNVLLNLLIDEEQKNEISQLKATANVAVTFSQID